MTKEKGKKTSRPKVLREGMASPARQASPAHVDGPGTPLVSEMPGILKTELSPLVEEAYKVLHRYSPESYGYRMAGLNTAQMRGEKTEAWARENRQRYPDPAKADKQMARERWEMATKVHNEYGWIWKPSTLADLAGSDDHKRNSALRLMADSVSQLGHLVRYLDQPGDEKLRQQLDDGRKKYAGLLRNAYLSTNGYTPTPHDSKRIG